jgi:hypothetical protein
MGMLRIFAPAMASKLQSERTRMGQRNLYLLDGNCEALPHEGEWVRGMRYLCAMENTNLRGILEMKPAVFYWLVVPGPKRPSG